jgi:hypothetical protein
MYERSMDERRLTKQIYGADLDGYLQLINKYGSLTRSNFRVKSVAT